MNKSRRIANRDKGTIALFVVWLIASTGSVLILMTRKFGLFELNRVYCIDCVMGMRNLAENFI